MMTTTTKLKLHVAGYNFECSESRVFTDRGAFTLVNEPDDCDVLVLCGGIDINPRLYGEKMMTRSGHNDRRDAMEIDAVMRATKAFKFGICRGGQLLNVLAGGSLWQDVDRHYTDHKMLDLATGRSIMTSSVHHQAFRVTSDAEIIATCFQSTRKLAEKVYWSKGIQEDVPDAATDVEVCYYKDLRYLCIQGHPEYGDNKFADYCYNLMQERI